MNRKILLSFLLLFIVIQETSAQRIIDSYIDSAFQTNIVLQQKNIALAEAQNALKTAKSYYLPSISLQTDYQTADGGRNIPLPLGDLLNPIYGTLNQLTSSNRFPSMKNESINFLPKNFHDAKVRTTMPLLNTELKYQNQIATQQIKLKEYEVLIYKRDLIKEIKVSYYNYLSAITVTEIYLAALNISKESLRVNQKLIENGKGLPAYVMRSKSEVSVVEAKLNEARLQMKNTALYFNFLLNRNGNTPILIDKSVACQQLTIENLLPKNSSEEREEIQAVNELKKINQHIRQMNKSFSIPKLGVFLDLGTQSEGFKFNNQTRYYLIGLHLEVPLFSGQRNQLKIKDAELNLAKTDLQIDLTTKQLDMKKNISKNELISIYQLYQASLKQAETAADYMRLIDKGYLEGVNSFVETIEAYNQWLSAKLSSNLNMFKVLIANANLERETASYPLP